MCVCVSSNIAHWNAIVIATDRLDFENGGGFQLVERNHISIARWSGSVAFFWSWCEKSYTIFRYASRENVLSRISFEWVFLCAFSISLACHICGCCQFEHAVGIESKSIWINANVMCACPFFNQPRVRPLVFLFPPSCFPLSHFVWNWFASLFQRCQYANIFACAPKWLDRTTDNSNNKMQH